MPEYLYDQPSTDRLDLFLSRAHPGLTRSQAKSLIQAGQVFLNDETNRTPSSQIRRGDVIRLQVVTQDVQHATIPIIYEDSEMFIVEKPAGLVVHRSSGSHTTSVIDSMIHEFPEIGLIGDSKRPGVVHRLDRDTSGLLAIARSDFGQLDLKEQWKNRETTKTYVAIVSGVPEVASAEIDAPIGISSRDPRKRTIVADTDPDRRSALSSYLTIETFSDQAAVLEVSIYTGRTHQIRVHLQGIGHPILGDELYGTSSELIPRQALHASVLGLKLPSTHEFREFHSPLPKDMQDCISALRQMFGTSI